MWCGLLNELVITNYRHTCTFPAISCSYLWHHIYHVVFLSSSFFFTTLNPTHFRVYVFSFLYLVLFYLSFLWKRRLGIFIFAILLVLRSHLFLKIGISRYSKIQTRRQECEETCNSISPAGKVMWSSSSYNKL